MGNGRSSGRGEKVGDERVNADGMEVLWREAAGNGKRREGKDVRTQWRAWKTKIDGKIEEENLLDRPGRTGREQENDNNKAVTYFYGPRRAQLGATLTCLSRVRGQDDGWTDSGGFFSGFRPPVSLVVAAVGGKAIECTENGWVPGLSVWSGLTGAETRLINK